jgi:hypothetical protein
MVSVRLVHTLVLPAAAALLLAAPVVGSAAESGAPRAPEDITQTCNQTEELDDPDAAALLQLLGVEAEPDSLVGIACLKGDHPEDGVVVCGPFDHGGVISIPVREGACEDEQP